MNMKKYFIDTNLVVYANDQRDQEKQEMAIIIISRLMKNRTGVISTQVLQEYAHVALKKLHQRQDVVLRQLALLESFEVIAQTPSLVRRSVEIGTAYQISFWDACIISAAEYGRCDTIYSEDLNSGQFYSGIAVVNPFLKSY
jgi:predicted nucleic acid-binding protein